MIQFSQCGISIDISVLNDFWYGFEVLTVLRIHNAGLSYDTV
jgi:hypothetical protein